MCLNVRQVNIFAFLLLIVTLPTGLHRPQVVLETSYRVTCWYKNLSYNDMSLFYQKQYLYFLMISISATCCNMRGYTVHMFKH